MDAAVAAGRDGWMDSCRGAFRAFLRDAPGAAASRVKAALSSLEANPGAHSRDWDFKQIVFAEGDSYLLLCSLFDEPFDHIYGSPIESLVGVLGPHSLRCDRYLFPPGHDPLSLDPGEVLIPLETRVVRPFEDTALEGGREAYYLHADGPTVLVRLLRHASHALHHIYDRATLRPWMVQAGDPATTQVVCLAKVLGALGDSSSAKVLRAATRHPHHFARWAAVQALAAIDFDLALERIVAALDDPHPEVRDAARRALERAAPAAACTA